MMLRFITMRTYTNYIPKILAHWLIAGLLIAIVIPVTVAQDNQDGTITGRVIDQATQEPIQNVNIIVSGTRLGTSTDENGEFSISNIPRGMHTIQFSHINYILYTYTHFIVSGFSESITIKMYDRSIEFDQVEVVDTLVDRFDGRRPAGYYYTREEIENSAALTFGQLIQTLVPRARVQESQGNLYIQLQLRQTIYQHHERMRDPYPLIILNGMKLGTSPVGLAGVAPPSQIEEFQVIRPPESQAIFGPEATHGAIIIETKRGRDDFDMLLSTKQKNFIVGGIVAFFISMIVIF